MWTKVFLAACFVAFLLVLRAEDPEGAAKGSNSSGAEPAEKKPAKPAAPLTKKERDALLRELAAESSRFNPKQPALTVAQVQKVLVKDVSEAV
ncbi:MAG: hypothetical protein J6331_04795, partial [Lentisphaeria bacterium]|nr:hypothetical protein [Lentisphaeria bacterium]